MSRKCKICRYVKTNDISYINAHIQKGDLSYREIVAFLDANYQDRKPWYPDNIGNHKTHINKLHSEELIKQAAEKGEIIPDTVFTQRDKIGSAESYEKLIAEYWLNYQRLKVKPGFDLAKKGYLDSISKLLEQLSREKVLEKDYLTQINILKEKRERDTPAQRCDLIMGWSVPSMLEKCKDNDEAKHYLIKLQEFIFNMDASLDSGKDKSLVAKEGIEWLYEKERGVI